MKETLPVPPERVKTPMPDPSGAAVFGDLSRYLCGRFLWIAASQIANVAMGWLVYEQTRSAMALGLVGLAAFLPKLLLVLPAGVVADRMDRRLILAACFSLNALAAAGLALLAMRSQVSVLWIYPLIVLMGTARSFAGPAAQAMMASLVPRSGLSRAAGMTSSVSKIATIAGPALGGLLFVLAPWAPFASAALGFALAVLLNLSIRPRSPARAKTPVTIGEAMEGVRFIFHRPVILGAISLDLFSVLLGGVTALLPIIVSDLLGAGPVALGLLRAMPALGAMAVGLWLSWRPLERDGGRTLFMTTAIFGFASIALAFSHDIRLTAGLLWLIGASDVVSVVIRQTLVQADTPDAMRGRVASVSMLFVGASNELGEFESGATAALFGLVPSILIGGCGTVLVVLLWAVLFPELRRRDWLLGPQGPDDLPLATGASPAGPSLRPAAHPKAT
jgi:MFS family permease